ncbi:hypothetical protein Plhal304r1_c021g0074911 [Plasmopara halstedii]
MYLMFLVFNLDVEYSEVIGIDADTVVLKDLMVFLHHSEFFHGVLDFFNDLRHASELYCMQ